MTPWSRIGVAAVVACVLDCGGSGTPAPSASGSNASAGAEHPPVGPKVYEHGSGSVSAAIGPAGGTLELASGPKVDIPPGALDQTQDIVLKEAPLTTAFSNQEHERTQGPTFVVGPAMEAPPGSMIRISIPLASYPENWGNIALGYEYPVQQMVGADEAEHTKWQYENARLTGGRAVADLPSINGYRFQFVLSNMSAQ